MNLALRWRDATAMPRGTMANRGADAPFPSVLVSVHAWAPRTKRERLDVMGSG